MTHKTRLSPPLAIRNEARSLFFGGATGVALGRGVDLGAAMPETSIGRGDTISVRGVPRLQWPSPARALASFAGVAPRALYGAEGRGGGRGVCRACGMQGGSQGWVLRRGVTPLDGHVLGAGEDALAAVPEDDLQHARGNRMTEGGLCRA